MKPRVSFSVLYLKKQAESRGFSALPVCSARMYHVQGLPLISSCLSDHKRQSEQKRRETGQDRTEPYLPFPAMEIMFFLDIYPQRMILYAFREKRCLLPRRSENSREIISAEDALTACMMPTLRERIVCTVFLPYAVAAKRKPILSPASPHREN